jgi:hypothetical protein
VSVITDRAARWAHRQADSYRSNEEDRPLGGYVGALGVYATGVGGLTLAARALGVMAPERVTPFDLALVGLATHKTSRILSKDAVTSVLRAPFTVYDEPSGDAELSEHPRKDSHAQHAVGELVTCPFCLAQWIATGFAAGLVFAPRFTRLASPRRARHVQHRHLRLPAARLRRFAKHGGLTSSAWAAVTAPQPIPAVGWESSPGMRVLVAPRNDKLWLGFSARRSYRRERSPDFCDESDLRCIPAPEAGSPLSGTTKGDNT